MFDWSQSFPLGFEQDIIHIGEDGRPDNAIRALQEVRAYTMHPRRPGPHVTQIRPHHAEGRTGAPVDALEFQVPIEPGPRSRYQEVASLFALIFKGNQGYDRIALYASRASTGPVLSPRSANGRRGQSTRFKPTMALLWRDCGPNCSKCHPMQERSTCTSARSIRWMSLFIPPVSRPNW